MPYTRPLVEQIYDIIDNIIDYDNSIFTYHDLQSVANKFVEIHQSPKNQFELNDNDINDIITLFTQPFRGTKILLEISFFNEQHIQLREPNSESYFELIKTFKDENENVLSINGVLRKFSRTGEQLYLIQKVIIDAKWYSEYFMWIHKHDDVMIGIKMNPAMGYSMFQI